MTRFPRVLLTCLSLLATTPAATAETDVATAEALVRASGLWFDMARLPHSIERAHRAERFRGVVTP